MFVRTFGRYLIGRRGARNDPVGGRSGGRLKRCGGGYGRHRDGGAAAEDDAPMSGLSRFHDAQAPIYETALAELEAGRKRSHWMWFVLPQIAGLGASEMSRRYAIADRAEAKAYLADPVLGPRLLACVAAAARHPSGTAEDIFGSVDARKLHSCLTLFRAVAPHGSPAAETLGAALTRFFDGAPDPATEAALRTEPDDRSSA